MRALFTLSLLVTLITGVFAISIAKTLWSSIEKNNTLYTKKIVLADQKRFLNYYQFDTLENISQFASSNFFEDAIPDWKKSHSYYLFNHITLPEHDNGISLQAWLDETRHQIELQENTINEQVTQTTKRNRTSLISGFFAYSLLLTMCWSSIYIWHRLRMNEILNKLVESNLYLKKKQADLTKANSIMGSILEDLNTERKRSSFAKINDQRLALVAKYSDDGLVGLDDNGYISSWNPKAEALFSKPESTMLHKPLHVLFDEQDNQKIRDATHSLSHKSPHVSTTVKWISTASPVIQYLEISITGLFSGDTVLGYSVIVRDVSSRIHEIEQLRLLIEATPNAIIMSDTDGHIIQANGHAEKSFGYSKFEILTLKIEDLLPEEFKNSHQILRQGYLKNPKIRRMGTDLALRARRKNGTFIFVEVGLAPVKLNEKWYVISAITDISDRIEAQHKLTEFNRSLTRKNREMEQFVYTVSHDLKAPLVTIAAFSHSIKATLGDECSDRVTHKMDRIIANAAKMEELITDLLEISRVMNRPLTITEFAINNVVQEVRDSLEEDLAGCKISTSIPSNLLISASRPQIVQCLQNIISNAEKYKRENTTTIIHIAASKKDGKVIISVKDNGIGIDKNLYDKIFDIFERGDVTAPGTGVGLAIVKSIIEKHGGTITVDSTLGAGSTFTLTLPQPDALTHHES
ncbi:PAS domain S-box protein [Marinagarivorans cellulosilyticus]|uniref:histidine kinase n=1 Tax=Marinagarivorans cellulosilyticus TaxID=2721545 RepID=A0AAN1WEZ6_9GAMM|nr:PAS domain S-box protein [Marinagarivorans cellulosilyticus]BCD96367.1 hypothetical protein MARGE09_P0567 [Marinagarivorans cellulosilyticus]